MGWLSQQNFTVTPSDFYSDSAPSQKKPEEPSDVREREERAALEPATTNGEDEPPETAGTSEHTLLLTHPSREGKCDHAYEY